MAIQTTKTMLMSVLLTATALSARDVTHFLPLEDGNEWIYRDKQTGNSLSIRVGTMAVIAGNLYYRLTGYVKEPLWVRFADEGLVYRDEERQADAPLTLFVPVGGGWFYAPHRICDQEGQVSEETVRYTGPAGSFSSALQIRYRTFDCADAGVEEEVYQPSIGLLRRVVSSIAGPRQYDLISAKVGKLHVRTDQSGAYTVSVRSSSDPAVAFVATLLLNVDQELLVRKPVGQEYDVVLKNESGQVLWRWSDGKVFPAAIEERVLLGRITHEVAIPANPNDHPLAPGKYVIEAWFTSGDGRTQFSAATSAEMK
jgi:hypothetical protein